MRSCLLSYIFLIKNRCNQKEKCTKTMWSEPLVSQIYSCYSIQNSYTGKKIKFAFLNNPPNGDLCRENTCFSSIVRFIFCNDKNMPYTFLLVYNSRDANGINT